MSGRPGATLSAILIAVVSMHGARAVHAQSWSVDLSAGRIVYTAVPVDPGGGHLVGTLRYDRTPSSWLYGGGALPLGGGDSFWTVAGGGGRWTPAGLRGTRVAPGIDAAAEAFVFRDRVLAQTGSGLTADLLPFIRLPTGSGYVELGAGWRGYAQSQAGLTTRRGLFESRARLAYGTAVRFHGQTRLVHADGTIYPFVGAAVETAGMNTPVHLRVHAGRWVGDLLSETTWGAAVTVPLGQDAALWAGVQREAPDPLYWNSARRTWSVGVTRRLGRSASPLPMVTAPGVVVIRVPASEVDTGTAPSVAGDFTNWQPVPMRREGTGWVARFTLAAGIYRYAFRAGNGDWFVPSSIPGRREDGFGGHVAVLVVS